ncbi:MAG TPA: hypothetical protein VEY07_09370 [Thermoplasmata archaeon]|nr:hypothetical protein [Thermoplasmata archaeon]
MPGRTTLSEEAEREERDDRDRLDVIDGKLRELRGRRDQLLTQVHQLADEQKALFDARQPRQESLEATHTEHRDLGRRLAELRRLRDAARTRLDEAVIAARLARQEIPPGAHVRPEQLRREMAELELRQQTRAIPLAEENALIDRLRELRRQLDAAEKSSQAIQLKHAQLKEKEEAVRQARLEVDRLGEEFQRTRVDRDRRMESMRAQLVGVGQLVAEIREKSRRRGEVMARLDALMAEVRSLEREGDRRVHASRQRRYEAKRAIVDYNRGVRAQVGTGEATDRVADAQLEELLKRGRVTLSG